MESNLTNEEDKVWRTFLHVSTRLLARLDSELRDAHNEPLTHFDVLSNLSEAEGQRLRMSELADQTLFSRSRLTYTVTNLEQRGLVAREPDPYDQRGIVAVLTPTGRRLHRQLAATHIGGIRRYFLDAVPDDKRSQLITTLTPVLNQVEAEPTTPV